MLCQLRGDGLLSNISAIDAWLPRRSTLPRIAGWVRVTGADGEYDLTQPGDPMETALAPDVAFVRARARAAARFRVKGQWRAWLVAVAIYRSGGQNLREAIMRGLQH